MVQYGIWIHISVFPYLCEKMTSHNLQFVSLETIWWDVEDGEHHVIISMRVVIKFEHLKPIKQEMDV